MGKVLSGSLVQSMMCAVSFYASQRDTGGDAMSQALQGTRQMQAELKVMHQGQEETTQLSSTQAHKESFTFKKDECQCKASQQVTDRLAVVVSCLDCVEVANAAGREWSRRKWYRKGMSFLACRQKGTELADHSEVGWAVVEEYDTDTLTDNPDNKRG